MFGLGVLVCQLVVAVVFDLLLGFVDACFTLLRHVLGLVFGCVFGIYVLRWFSLDLVVVGRCLHGG